jgi:hypothetical protein
MQSRYRPVLDCLEDRLVPSTFYWNGTQNANWNLASNWTDVANSAHHAVPGATDTAIIRSSSNDPSLQSNQSVGGLEVDGGTLTIKNCTLTDAGAFVQTGGSVEFFKSSDRLQIAGDVTRTGGAFPTYNTVGGIVELNGTAAQHYAGRTYSRLPTTIIDNTSADGVILLGDMPGGQGIGVFYGTNLTVNAGSKLTLTQNASAAFVWLSGDFNLNGSLSLTQLSPNGGAATSLVHVHGTLALGSGSELDMHVCPAVASAEYSFAQYGAVTGTALFNVAGYGFCEATCDCGPDMLTAILAPTAPST